MRCWLVRKVFGVVVVNVNSLLLDLFWRLLFWDETFLFVFLNQLFEIESKEFVLLR